MLQHNLTFECLVFARLLRTLASAFSERAHGWRESARTTVSWRFRLIAGRSPKGFWQPTNAAWNAANDWPLWLAGVDACRNPYWSTKVEKAVGVAKRCHFYGTKHCYLKMVNFVSRHMTVWYKFYLRLEMEHRTKRCWRTLLLPVIFAMSNNSQSCC